MTVKLSFNGYQGKSNQLKPISTNDELDKILRNAFTFFKSVSCSTETIKEE